MTRRAPLTAHDELRALLRPAGGGLHTVSTGRAEQEALQRRLYDATTSTGVRAAFERAIEQVGEAKLIVLGVPSDVGAGVRRGANLGPQAIRAAWLDANREWRDEAAARGIVDLGDVFVVPQLQHDSMLSDAQLAASRRALYPELEAALPVSPLSIEERALDLVLAINPRAKLLVLGGDHSVAWPVAAALHRARGDFAIVQSDAHTDLLPERLGVRYCFATWTYHANELLGRGGRVMQVGIRASGKSEAHWEQTLGVEQYWADECRAEPQRVLDEVVARAREFGRVYFSNDIDGTDAAYASATGTPEPHGLTPEWLEALIDRLGEETDVVAADLVEVAPELGDPSGRARTLETSVRYLRRTIDALLRT